MPKVQFVLMGVSVMTAPRGCMTRLTTCGESNVASVVMVSVSAKAEASFGLATAAGIPDGVTVMVTVPLMGTFAGRVAPLPDSVYGLLAPLPRARPVMLKAWLPRF